MLVVGAGPAGSATALRLARGGRARPARRPGALPARQAVRRRPHRAVRSGTRPCDVSPVVEHEVDRFELGLRYRRRFVRRSDVPLIRMTQRRRLDAFLAEQAALAGADFRDGVTVGGLAVGPDGAEATVGDGPRPRGRGRGRGRGERRHGPRCGRRARRRARRGTRGQRGLRRRRSRPLRAAGPSSSWGPCPGGYGWVFPKGDHANVGVGGWPGRGAEDPRASAPPVRRPRDRRRAAHRRARPPAADAACGLAGRVRARAARRATRPALVDPLSGDGIYEAFVAAELASRGDPRAGRSTSTRPGSQATLGPHAGASWAAKSALDRFPRHVLGDREHPPRVAGRRRASAGRRRPPAMRHAASPGRRSG